MKVSWPLSFATLTPLRYNMVIISTNVCLLWIWRKISNTSRSGHLQRIRRSISLLLSLVPYHIVLMRRMQFLSIRIWGFSAVPLTYKPYTLHHSVVWCWDWSTYLNFKFVMDIHKLTKLHTNENIIYGLNKQINK